MAVLFGFIIIILLAAETKTFKVAKDKLPNFVMIIADDLGIGDLGCYGNTTIKTPNIDRLAKEGILLRHHLAAAGLCTPSRAALLTARYPSRCGMYGDINTPPVIVHVASQVGLPDSETTIAEAFSAAGYATAIIGKWHLGSGCGWFGYHCLGPLNHGFDYFYGMLYTLDSPMAGEHSFWIFDLTDAFYETFLAIILVLLTTLVCFVKKQLIWMFWIMLITGLILLPFVWFMYTHYRVHTATWWKVSPWMMQHLDGVVMRNGELVHQKVPFDSITHDLLNESVTFIYNSAKRGQSFFLFHSFLKVHTPLFPSREHAGKSAHGRYGDSVEELDSVVGELLDALTEAGVDRSTVVMFASDHGGHLEAVDPISGERLGGYNGRFKGGKGMGAPEGAIRIPGIIRWTGVLPAGAIVDSPTSLLDILPTFVDLAEFSSLDTLIPGSKKLDGVSIAPRLKNVSVKGFQERVLIHHCRSAIHGLRLVTSEKVYKMYLYLHRWQQNSTQCGWGNVLCGCFGGDVIDVRESPVLYELGSDPYEDRPLSPETFEYQEVVKELSSYLEKWKKTVPFVPSQYNSKLKTVLSPWLQPFPYRI